MSRSLVQSRRSISCNEVANINWGTNRCCFTDLVQAVCRLANTEPKWIQSETSSINIPCLCCHFTQRRHKASHVFFFFLCFSFVILQSQFEMYFHQYICGNLSTSSLLLLLVLLNCIVRSRRPPGQGNPWTFTVPRRIPSELKSISETNKWTSIELVR